MSGTHEGAHNVFPQIYFGSLLAASVLAFVLHRRWGALPKVGERFYDVIILVLGFWCLGGLLIDAFAHIAGQVDDTFFTEWHAVWYSGATAYGAYIFYAVMPEGGVREMLRRPFGVLSDVAPEHRPGVWGIIVFFISGFGDMIWHETLGVESNLDILLSPTHIGLFAGLMLSVTGPLWSAWADPKSGVNGLRSQALPIFGLGAAWCVVLLIVRYTHPWIMGINEYCYTAEYSYTCWNSDYNTALATGMRALLIHAALTSAVLLLFLRRWTPAPGSLAVLVSFHALGTWVYAEFDQSMLVMGLIWAVLVEALRFMWIRGWRASFVAAAVALQVLVFQVTLLVRGPWATWWEGTDLHMVPFGWTVHATFGAVVLCAFVGVMATTLAFPPALPDMSESEQA